MNPTSEEHDRRRTPLRWVRYPASGRASELEEMVSVTEAVTAVVIDGDEISQSDTDGADIVITIAEELRAFDVSPSFARVGPEIRDLWQRAGVMEAVEPERSSPRFARPWTLSHPTWDPHPGMGRRVLERPGALRPMWRGARLERLPHGWHPGLRLWEVGPLARGRSATGAGSRAPRTF